MSTPIATSQSPLKANRGLALLLVLTLLGFLLVLLLGLATYTRVETAVSGNTQRQAQARQHALLALDVALSQLQKFAGPDQRVTATGEATGGANAHYTGVWSSDPATASGTAPLTWLVSGSETPANTALTPQQLVGLQTAGTGNNAAFVTAPLVNIKTYGVPGQFANDTAATGGTTIGRYAWWVGDQGVKAPVALADATTLAANFNYAPYTSAELRSRIRQQLSLGAGAFDTITNAPAFEPRDTTGNSANPSNATLAANVIATNQLAFFKKTGGTVGLTTLRQNFHNWSPSNFNVLANTKLGGLRQDISIDPTLLGAAFAAWVNYDPANGGYMEDHLSPVDPTPVPAYIADPVRRRYNITPPVTAGGAVAGVAPVLAMCGLSFNIRTVNGLSNQPLEVRARWYVSLWNPYTSALVPQDLRLEIEGLPDPVTVTITNVTTGAVIGTESISLNTLFADSANASRPFPINLAWPAASAPTTADYQSWLPGRVYTWISNPHSLATTPAGGLDGSFYVTSFSTVAEQGDTRATGGPTYSSVSNLQGSISFNGPVHLVAKLYRTSDTAPLASFAAPDFLGVVGTAPQGLTASNYQFGFQFRLFESGHIDTGDKGQWLTSATLGDLRARNVPAAAFRLDPKKADDPAQYQTSLDFADTKFLLDRTQGNSSSTSRSYDEDTPVFELPRAPILSLGELQHLQLESARPFSVGNSWGAEKMVNGITTGALFDQFFFSGLVPNVAPTGAQLLPNPLLRVLSRNPATGAAVTAGDLRTAPGAVSSKFLLQGGAFNLNSVSPAAWIAVLRGVRFPSPQVFSHLNASFTSGTSGDSKTQLPSSNDAQFFRFPQSAQETYEADNPAGGSTYAASTDAPPNPPNPTSTANTHLFRRGMRTLTTTQVVALAGKITDAIKAHQVASGPFRSLEEFLGPVTSGSPSLIEQAIVDADLAGAQINVDANGNAIEFSSQFLTQGDIMTALAPVLFPRSDTFIIRAYGEAVNPTTAATEGRAWCEATVQRVPEYFDPSAATGDQAEVAPSALKSTLNQTFGRRFKIVSFRWLTRSDI